MEKAIENYHSEPYFVGAAISPPVKTHRRHLQPGLQVLLLSLEGDALSGRPVPHVRQMLDTYIRQLLEAQPADEVNVAWQGGEPTLMGLDFFRRSIHYVEQYRRPGQRVLHTMQTNGTLLDDEWCAFFKQHHFLVGLSVDGPKEMHDVYRVNKGGAGSFDQMIRGWELLRRHDVDVNILCTIHAANADYPLEVYRFFRDELETEFIQFIPIVERTTQDFLPMANLGWGERPGSDRPLYTQHGGLVTDVQSAPNSSADS